MSLGRPNSYTRLQLFLPATILAHTICSSVTSFSVFPVKLVWKLDCQDRDLDRSSGRFLWSAAHFLCQVPVHMFFWYSLPFRPSFGYVSTVLGFLLVRLFCRLLARLFGRLLARLPSLAPWLVSLLGSWCESLVTSMENLNHDQRDTVFKACTLGPYIYNTSIAMR